MGIGYHVFPLDEEGTQLFRDMGVALPADTASSRNPTPSEVRSIALSLTDLRVTMTSPPEHEWWQVSFEGLGDSGSEPWTVLNVDGFNGDETTPHSIWFEKGWPSVVLRVVHALSATCGPLVILPDNDCEAIVVDPRDDLEALRRQWKHRGQHPL